MPRQTTSVKNINGTSKPRYVVSNLSAKYQDAGGTKSNKCQVSGCSKDATATAHVRKTHGNASSSWNLTKTCASHNSSHNTQNMKVDSSSLVPLKNIH